MAEGVVTGQKNRQPRRRFGRVRQLASGRWQARYSGPDGQLRTAPTTFGRRGEAERFLSEAETDIARGDWFDPLAGRMPLGQYGLRWIEERDLSVRTAELYRGLLKNHITPEIGQLTLADLAPPTIRRWRRLLRDHGVSEGVIAKAYRLLHAVLSTAVEDGSIRANPCNIKGASQHNADERPVATLEQVFALAVAIQSRYRLVVLLATFTSLRYGEIMGLRRRDFALRDRKVKIDRAHIQPDTGPMFDGEPKANSGRTVSLPAFLVPEVEAHLAEFVEPEPDAYIFLGPKGARPARSNFHTIWNKARHQAGVPHLHLHDLRHTGNTLAAETGATLRELMDRMGHRSTRAALIYLHARDQRDRAIADGLDTIVGTAHLATPQTVSDRHEGHAGGTKQQQPSAKRPQLTRDKTSTSKNARSGRPGSNRHGQLGRLGLYH
jgi:integrase